MPANFSLSLLLLISSGYLLLLFCIAWLSERGVVPRRLVHHPLVYTLSLGVYASVWAFYGTVGMAYESGYGFLAYYLGISGAFLLAPVLLQPILRITRTYQLASLADLFAFRFRSSWAGALTALFMLIGLLPLLALQIKAVADSTAIITLEPRQHLVALAFCGLIILFTMLFGARHVANRSKHEGLVFAIAFESLVKLIAISAVGLYAVYGVFGGPEELQAWLQLNRSSLDALHTPLEDGSWRVLLLACFAAAIVMPHMYHMTFSENLNPRALSSASWGLPLFMLLMGLAVPPILWAGIHLQAPTSPTYFTLGIGLAVNSDLLSLLAFVGGLSAASGLMIVLTLAVSGMVLNHLVLPVYQPAADSNIYGWLKWMRRALIASVIMAGYGFYLMLDGRQNINLLGVTAFIATLHFLPGTLATLYWPAANHRGFIAGILAGVGIWLSMTLLPLLLDLQSLQIPLLGLELPLGDSHWYETTVISLLANILLLVLFSLFSQTSQEERRAAADCSLNSVSRSTRRMLRATSPQQFASELAKPLGAKTAQREVEQALRDLHLPFDEERPYALRRLRDRLEANLSGLLGPSIARDMLRTFLPYKGDEAELVSEDIHFTESRLEDYQSRLTGLAAELDSLRRYHRQTLQDLPMGVCSLAKDQEILMWNHALATLTGIPGQRVIGSRLDALEEPWRSLLGDFIEQPEQHLHKQRLNIRGRPHWINLHKAAIEEPLAPGNSGLVVLVEDATETRLLEDKLVHSERLASIGRLASGVAHEIGNPVTGIACLAQNLREERDADAEVSEVSSQIIDQTKRISRIVQSLMSFAHAGSQQNDPLPVCLADISSEAINLLSLNREGNEVQYFNLCDPEHLASGDPQRLAQVLVNLLSNARDASFAGGCIRVSSSASEDSVVLSVEDEGSGISREIADRLFEPFVTTKDPGKGTGLGLAMVYSIVEEHYGHVSIESPTNPETLRGTRFRVTLPRYVEETGAEH
jgi:Na+/proline symporter/signal transduction histidine kinase